MSDVLIEKNIPVPPLKNGRIKYPWHEMDVGDSFVIPKLTVSMGAVNKRYQPKKFILRSHQDGYRIWRTD